jgi:hypothetical protein
MSVAGLLSPMKMRFASRFLPFWTKLNYTVWVRERTISTERPPLVSEVIANCWSAWRIPTAVFSIFSPSGYIERKLGDINQKHTEIIPENNGWSWQFAIKFHGDRLGQSSRFTVIIIIIVIIVIILQKINVAVESPWGLTNFSSLNFLRECCQTMPCHDCWYKGYQWRLCCRFCSVISMCRVHALT